MSDSDFPEISKPVRHDTTSVLLVCPHCLESDEYQASSWQQINTKGVFVIAPTVTYGVICQACQGAFHFRPKASKYGWPSGSNMEVECPNCARTMATQISMVRDNDLPLRPEDCEACNAQFEVYPDGKTELVSAPRSGPPTERALKAIKFFESVTFDPNSARDWPFTTEVEQLVTVAWLHEFDDGTQQFMDADQEPPQVYSPRMTPGALERFCEENIEAYRAFYDNNEAALDRRESVPMVPFW